MSLTVSTIVSKSGGGISSRSEIDFAKHIALTSSCVFIALFSPLISFYLCIFFLLAFTQHLDKKTVSWIGYICAYSGSVMIASRKTFEPSDDFAHYFHAYLSIMHNGWQAIPNPYGTEIGLPFYFWVLSWLGITSQIFPLFAVAMLSSSLFVFWLNKYGSLRFPSSNYGTMMAVSLLFYSFLSASLVSRQMVGLSLTLLAISTVGWRSFAWLISALLFHQSSILTFMLLKFAKRLNWYWVIIVLILGILFLLEFHQVVEIAVQSNLDFIRVVSKFEYYTTSTQSYTSADLSGLKFVTLCFVATLLSAKYMPEGWGLMILLVTILYVLFLPYALIPLRTFLFFVAVFAGYIATFLGYRIGWSVLSWGSAVYAIYTLVKLATLGQDYPFLLWDKFDWVGIFPLYYFSS